MKKVYVAARWQDRDYAKAVADRLWQERIPVTSTWTEPGDTQSMGTLKQDDPLYIKRIAERDMREIHEADVLVLLQPKSGLRSGTGGKHVETGVALAIGREIYVVGERENVFHYLPYVTQVDSVDGLVAALKGTVLNVPAETS